MGNEITVTDNTGKFVKIFKDGMQDNLLAATMLWHGAIQEELTGARSGRVYRVPGTKRRYTASAPGEAPARRTGRLAQAVKYTVKNDFGEVGYDRSKGVSGKRSIRVADYAMMLEKGTSKMAKRPFIEPSYTKNAKKIEAELTRPIGGMS